MSAINRLIRNVQAALVEYDKSGDHAHVGSPPGDCLRCALKPFETLAPEALDEAPEPTTEHTLVLRTFGNGSTPEREHETGPFTSHAEAERTLRGAMTTGRFVSGTIVTREKKSKIAGTFHPDVAIDALKALISTVEQTGGLLHGENIGDEPGENEDAPAADPDWIDLATAYLLACEALGREPVYSDKEVRS